MPPFDSLKQVVIQLAAITPDELHVQLSQTVTKYEGEIKNISQDKSLEPSAKVAKYKGLRDRINETKTRYTAYLQSLKVEENKPTVQNFLGELDRLTKSLDEKITTLEREMQAAQEAAQASALQASSAEAAKDLQPPPAPTLPEAPTEEALKKQALTKVNELLGSNLNDLKEGDEVTIEGIKFKCSYYSIHTGDSSYRVDFFHDDTTIIMSNSYDSYIKIAGVDYPMGSNAEIKELLLGQSDVVKNKIKQGEALKKQALTKVNELLGSNLTDLKEGDEVTIEGIKFKCSYYSIRTGDSSYRVDFSHDDTEIILSSPVSLGNNIYIAGTEHPIASNVDVKKLLSRTPETAEKPAPTPPPAEAPTPPEAPTLPQAPTPTPREEALKKQLLDKVNELLGLDLKDLKEGDEVKIEGLRFKCNFVRITAPEEYTSYSTFFNYGDVVIHIGSFGDYIKIAGTEHPITSNADVKKLLSDIVRQESLPSKTRKELDQKLSRLAGKYSLQNIFLWNDLDYNIAEVDQSIPKLKKALELLNEQERRNIQYQIVVTHDGREGSLDTAEKDAVFGIDYKKSAQEIADKLREASKRGEVELALSDLAKKYGLPKMFLWGNQEYDVAEVSQSMSELEKALGMLNEQERRNIKYRIVVTHDGEEGPLNTAGKSQVFGIDYKKSAQEIADKLKEAPLTPLMQEFEKLNYDFKGMIGSESESRKKFAEEIMFICKIRHVSASDIKWEEIFPAESNIDYSGGPPIVTAPVARANTNLETLEKVEKWIRKNLGKTKNPRKTKGSKSGVTETTHKLPLELATLKASFDATANFHPGLEWTPELQAKLETIKTTIRALESAGHEPTVLKMGNKIYIVSGAAETPAGTRDRTYAEAAAAATSLGVNLMSEAQYRAINPSIKQLDVAGWTWLQTDDLSSGHALVGDLRDVGAVNVNRYDAGYRNDNRGWRASLRVNP